MDDGHIASELGPDVHGSIHTSRSHRVEAGMIVEVERERSPVGSFHLAPAPSPAWMGIVEVGLI